MSARDSRTIALVGLRCSGKTSVGLELARRMRRAFVDLDLEVLAAHGRTERVESVGDVLVSIGEPKFRELESRALRDALARTDPIVLATGGGAVELAPNRAELTRRSRVVWLREEVSVLQARLAADSTHRPGLLGSDPIAELPELARRREPLYREVAEVVLECKGERPARIAERVAEILGVALPSDSENRREG